MPFSRRRFLEQGLVAAAGLPVARSLLRGEPLPKAAPSERVRLGFIGLGGMGLATLQAMRAQPAAEVVALCDIYTPHLERAKAATEGKALTFKNHEELLARDEVDAVVLSTPDHWHALCAVAACKAGKHVYCEKPLGHNIAEGRAMVAAARKTQCVTQMGIQIHAGENYHRVVDLVRSGVLGHIHKIHTWVSRSPLGIGKPADSAPPEGLDWERWQGPAEARPFNRNRFLFHWRWFWDYAGGLLADMGCHVLDLVHWAMNVRAPLSVTASGGKLLDVDNTTTPDTLEAVWEYPGFVLTWSHTTLSSQGPYGRGLGVLFHGTQGSLLADYGTLQLRDERGQPRELPKIEQPIPRSPGHHREWLEAIKAGRTCGTDFEYGHRLTTVCHLGNIALRTGRKLHWDAEAERFTGHGAEEGNRFLSRSYRAPWHLPAE